MNMEQRIDLIGQPGWKSPEYFAPEHKYTIAVLLAEGKDAPAALTTALGNEPSPDDLLAFKRLLADRAFQNSINTIVANDLLATGMAKAWKAVNDILDEQKRTNLSLQAASWVRDTLKEMAAGTLGSAADNLSSLSRDDLQAVLADAKARARILAKPSDETRAN